MSIVWSASNLTLDYWKITHWNRTPNIVQATSYRRYSELHNSRQKIYTLLMKMPKQTIYATRTSRPGNLLTSSRFQLPTQLQHSKDPTKCEQRVVCQPLWTPPRATITNYGSWENSYLSSYHHVPQIRWSCSLTPQSREKIYSNNPQWMQWWPLRELVCLQIRNIKGHPVTKPDKTSRWLSRGSDREW